MSSNPLDLLLFSLGHQEIFGINVFKVREVCDMLPITQTPQSNAALKGVVSLRGVLMPVIDLAESIRMPSDAPRTKLLITEICGQIQAFQVADVDRIVRLDWNRIQSPRAVPSANSSYLSSLTELDNGTLVSILDLEQVLGDVVGLEPEVASLSPLPEAQRRPVFFADDSAFARRKIASVLDALGLSHHHAVDGTHAWRELERAAQSAERAGRPLRQSLGLILLDAEMPGMDGYELTRRIKADSRLQGIPVVMHSSLSSGANRRLGEAVGVDAYVVKFNSEELARAIRQQLGG
jgi:two-component system chemotaxis response regulator CheV